MSVPRLVRTQHRSAWLYYSLSTPERSIIYGAHYLEPADTSRYHLWRASVFTVSRFSLFDAHSVVALRPRFDGPTFVSFAVQLPFCGNPRCRASVQRDRSVDVTDPSRAARPCKPVTAGKLSTGHLREAARKWRKRYNNSVRRRLAHPSDDTSSVSSRARYGRLPIVCHWAQGTRRHAEKSPTPCFLCLTTTMHLLVLFIFYNFRRYLLVLTTTFTFTSPTNLVLNNMICCWYLHLDVHIGRRSLLAVS